MAEPKTLSGTWTGGDVTGQFEGSEAPAGTSTSTFNCSLVLGAGGTFTATPARPPPAGTVEVDQFTPYNATATSDVHKFRHTGVGNYALVITGARGYQRHRQLQQQGYKERAGLSQGER
jgi:hypothetical protein